MTQEENLKLVLNNTIEKVLFNENGLITLKDLIHKVSIGAISAKTFREFIINFRQDNLEKLTEELLDIFNFHATQISIKNQLSEFTSEGDSQMEADLQEKNQLLKTLAIRVNNMHKKLKNKLKISG